MAGDTIFARLKVIGAARFRRDMDDAGRSTANVGDSARKSRRGLGEMEKGTASLTGGLRALAIVAGITAGVQGFGLLVQGAGAGIVALGALGVAALGAGVVLGGFAAGAAKRFEQMADVGGTAANDLKTKFGEFKTLLSDELGPAFDPVFAALAGALGPLGNLVRAIAPAFAVLGNAIADGVTQAAGLLETFGPGLSQLLTGVAGLIPPLVDLFGTLAGILLVVANTAMPYLQAGVEKLAFWLSGLSSDQITGAVTGAFQTLGVVFGTLAGIAGTVWPIFQALAVGLGQIAAGALPGLTAGIKALTPAFQAIVASGVLRTLAAAIGDTFAIAARVIGTVVVGLQRMGLLKPVILGLVGAFVAYKAAMIAARVAMVALGVVGNVVRGVMMAWRGAVMAARGAQLLLNLAMRMNPIGMLITALVLLGLGFVALWKKSETFRRIVTGAWNGIKAAAGAAAGFVRDKFNGLVSFFSGLPGKIASAALSIGKGMVEGIANGIKGAGNLIVDALTAIIPGPLKSVLKAAGGGLGALGDFVFRADGGPIPGGAPYLDRVPAMLTPGEHVWTRGEVAAAGGHGAVARLRSTAGASGGRPAPETAPRAAAPRTRERVLQPIILKLEKRTLATTMADIYLDLDGGIPT